MHELLELLAEVLRDCVEGCLLVCLAFPGRMRRHGVTKLLPAERRDLAALRSLDIASQRIEKNHRADGGHAPLPVRPHIPLFRATDEYGEIRASQLHDAPIVSALDTTSCAKLLRNSGDIPAPYFGA